MIEYVWKRKKNYGTKKKVASLKKIFFFFEKRREKMKEMEQR